MMITKNLSNTEKREEEEERWKIYILKILIAMFDKCEVEHMLFFILSSVCHRLSNACPTLAIVSPLDDVRALDGALSMAPKLSVTPSPNDEQNIRHKFEIFDLDNKKFAFIYICLKICDAKSFEHFFHMYVVFFTILTINQNIVQICRAKII